MWYSAVGCSMMLTLSLLAVPLPAGAQPAGQMRRIGLLRAGVTSGVASMDFERNFEAFRQGLRDLGWVEGQNLTIEYRTTEGHTERLPALAAELVGLPVEVIVTMGLTTRAAQDATRTIPIVMGGDPNPVEAGFIASLARPGGNITGLTGLQSELSGKRLELLKEAVPQASRIAVLMHPTSRDGASMRETQAAAQVLGVELHPIEVSRPDEIAGAFAAVQQMSAGALLVLTNPSMIEQHRGEVTALALQHRLPAMYPWRQYVAVGGLMSYGVSPRWMYQRAAYYVDKILKGAKPADLPVEQPTKFELVINLKAAKALGITMPPSLLLLADEVIQ
jgi:putative tryptophan/tyrosine transport system substrate-binding protein